MALTHIYLPDDFIMKVLNRTLEYVDAHKIPSGYRFKIGSADIFHFFAILYYMGYCKLPSVADY